MQQQQQQQKFSQTNEKVESNSLYLQADAFNSFHNSNQQKSVEQSLPVSNETQQVNYDFINL